MSKEEFNPFKILNVSSSDSLEQIKKAYYKKAKEFHSDLTQNSDDMMKKVNAAYEILKDENKRRDFLMSNEESDLDVLNDESLRLGEGERLSKRVEELLKEYENKAKYVNYQTDFDFDPFFSEIIKNLKEQVNGFEEKKSSNSSTCKLCLFQECEKPKHKKIFDDYILSRQKHTLQEAIGSLLIHEYLIWKKTQNYEEFSSYFQWNSQKYFQSKEISNKFHQIYQKEETLISKTDSIIIKVDNESKETFDFWKYWMGKMCNEKISKPTPIIKEFEEYLSKFERINLPINKEKRSYCSCGYKFGYIFYKGNTCKSCGGWYCSECLFNFKITMNSNITELCYKCIDNIRLNHMELLIRFIEEFSHLEKAKQLLYYLHSFSKGNLPKGNYIIDTSKMWKNLERKFQNWKRFDLLLLTLNFRENTEFKEYFNYSNQFISENNFSLSYLFLKNAINKLNNQNILSNAIKEIEQDSNSKNWILLLIILDINTWTQVFIQNFQRKNIQVIENFTIFSKFLLENGHLKNIFEILSNKNLLDEMLYLLSSLPLKEITFSFQYDNIKIQIDKGNIELYFENIPKLINIFKIISFGIKLNINLNESNTLISIMKSFIKESLDLKEWKQHLITITKSKILDVDLLTIYYSLFIRLFKTDKSLSSDLIKNNNIPELLNLWKVSSSYNLEDLKKYIFEISLKNPSNIITSLVKSSGLNVVEMGNEFFNNNNYMIALDLYLLSKDNLKTLLLEKAKISNDVNVALFYYYHCLTQKDSHITIVKNLIKLLNESQALTILYAYHKDHPEEISLLLELYFKFPEIQKMDDIKLYYLHEKQLNQQYIELRSNILYNSLMALANKMDIKNLSTILIDLNPNYLYVIEKCFKELTKSFDIFKLEPGDYKSFLLMMMIKIEKNNKRKLELVNELLFSHWSDDVIHFVNEILTEPSIRSQNVLETIEFFQKYKFSTPNTIIFGNRFKNTTILLSSRKFEQSIIKHSHTLLESALLYIDLSMVSGGPLSFCSNNILSINYFIQDIQSQISNIPHLVAVWKVILDRTINLWFVLQRLQPTLRFHYTKLLIWHLKYAFDLLKNSLKKQNTKKTNEELVSSFHLDILKSFGDYIIENQSKIPISNIKFQTSFDMIFVSHISDILYRENMLSYSKKNDKFIKPYDAKYQIFEGTWIGWNLYDDFQEKRVETIEEFMKLANIPIQYIEHVLKCPLLNRDKNGYLLQKKTPLNFGNEKKYSDFRGISLNMNTGELLLDLDDSGEGLFTMDDIKEIFQSGITSAHFTLDPASDSQEYLPFQEMKYCPNTLEDTSYLDTMFHCDYLLKMFTCGSEVSANYPFNLKSSDDLLSRLPKSLRENLKPLNGSIGKCHRFWIETGDLMWDKSDDDNALSIQFGDFQMMVNTRPMIRDKDNKLIDAPEYDKNTEEFKFAKYFTDNYDEIGKYFPELLRLKQLAKISVFYFEILKKYLILKDIKEQYQTKVKPQLEKELKEKRSKIISLSDYPSWTNYNIDKKTTEIVDETIRKSGYSRHQVDVSSLRNNVYHQVSDNLKSNDQYICDELSKNYSSKEVSITSYQIDQWLKGSLSSLSLANDIIDQTLYKNNRICNLIINLNINVDYKSQVSDQLFSDIICPYVPAAFHQDGVLIYGGVRMNPNLINKDRLQRLRQLRHRINVDTFKGKYGSEAIPTTSFIKAKANFKKLTSQDPNTPSNIRGWLNTQYEQKRSWYKVNNPPGYQVGHRIPGHHNPYTFRWETQKDNNFKSKYRM